MRYILLDAFEDELTSFSSGVQDRFWKQLQFLLDNMRHPSLHAKKYEETKGIWQARVDKSVRFYFLIVDDCYILLHIKHHS